MNISLADAKKKAKKGSIGYGLNKRGASGENISDAFDGSSSSDEEVGDQQSSNRGRVNQQIAKEQEALRKRAQSAASVVDASVYDYDGAYDSFKPALKEETSKGNDERKSRYIGDLLKAAKKRERERDVVYERKVAMEQAEEDLQADYQGKEKFVTRAYKRKLEERKQWELEEKQKDDEEEQNDVTKKVAGAAFASFYGNFNRNVSIGGGGGGADSEEEKEDNTLHDDVNSQTLEQLEERKLGFMDGFERDDKAAKPTNQIGVGQEVARGHKEPQKASAFSQREKREKKVAEAKRRYLERRAAAVVQQ
ncbi:unnamed protein product [Cylindrotheca closterium]|uniref:Nuclear speckle splicing regulatory protein 1 N-terminal domain-containing protein n=1 Tax=Cylindrotheca closterium TaxID=2856 RepID=A0AAD2FRG1_9STRA|nr:unnamed protein product [Cylindrotheca closterium]